MNELGDMLKKLRESRGLSLNALAQKLKVSTSYLWRLENGLSSNPSRNFCKKVAAFFGKDPAIFLRGGNEEETETVTDEAIQAVTARLSNRERRLLLEWANSLAEAHDIRREQAEAAANLPVRRAPRRNREGARAAQRGA